MSEQLWYCNHWGRDHAPGLYKVIDDKLYRRDRFNDLGEWKEYNGGFRFVNPNLISVWTYGTNPVGFLLEKF